ncbi:hypothetical protein [Pseudoalteromonas xiamenensis]
MNFVDYKQLVSKVKCGKQLPTAVYVHKSAIVECLPDAIEQLIHNAASLYAPTFDWNVVKVFKRDFKVTLLNYPTFDTYAYPALHSCITIDLTLQTAKFIDYSNSDNPPILHRKELFVASNHALKSLFEQITQEGEHIGLYENTTTIGTKTNWERLIKKKGFDLDEQGRLKKLATTVSIPIAPEPNDPQLNNTIARHLTAINRDKLSAPFQKLAKFGYLNGEYSLLDYGCGRGDDYVELECHGLNINAWDPVHKQTVF